MCAVVEPCALPFNRGGASAERCAGFKKGRVESFPRELQGGANPRDSAAEHAYRAVVFRLRVVFARAFNRVVGEFDFLPFAQFYGLFGDIEAAVCDCVEDSLVDCPHDERGFHCGSVLLWQESVGLGEEVLCPEVHQLEELAAVRIFFGVREVGFCQPEKFELALGHIAAVLRAHIVDYVAQNVRELQGVAEGFGEFFRALVFESENVYRRQSDCRRDPVAVLFYVGESFEGLVVGVAHYAVDNRLNVLLRDFPAGDYVRHFRREGAEVFRALVYRADFVFPRSQFRAFFLRVAVFLVGDVVH